MYFIGTRGWNRTRWAHFQRVKYIPKARLAYRTRGCVETGYEARLTSGDSSGSLTCAAMKNDICGVAYGRDNVSGYGARTKYTVNYATTKSGCVHII